jgi:carboxymethylenebutenolidase
MPDITITTSDNKTMNAYIARPKGRGPAPVIIAIQEIFGVNQDMRDKCDDLAAQGYIALCPDLFWRIEPSISLVDSKPEELTRAFELFSLFDVEAGIKDLTATLKAARTLDSANNTRGVEGGTHDREDTRGAKGGTPDRESNKVGCVGYCLGGKMAALMAIHTDIDAAVSYYGVGIEDMLDDKASKQNPTLLHIAGNDEFVPPQAQDAIIAAFQDTNHVQTHRYEGMDHAFARGNGTHYNAQAADLANARTAAFFKDKLQ